MLKEPKRIIAEEPRAPDYSNDEVRTRIYYCDPNRSDQKGALEKNHEYIRYVLPKGTSFESKRLNLG